MPRRRRRLISCAANTVHAPHRCPRALDRRGVAEELKDVVQHNDIRRLQPRL
eukprot:COSAG01_NODE_59559_length_299_cov_1.865000_1_plen_51_part_10